MLKMSEQTNELFKALAEFQQEVKQPKKDADNPFFKSKYVPLESVIDVIHTYGGPHGLGEVTIPAVSENGLEFGVGVMMTHSSGQYIQFPAITMKPDKATPQGIGSAMTYARRYALSSAFGIASEADDDANAISGNGKKAEPPKPATAIQIKAITKEIERMAELAGIAYEKAEKGILTHMNISKKLKDITNEEYGTMLDYINKTIPVYEKKAAEKAAADTNAEQVDMKMQYNIPEK